MDAHIGTDLTPSNFNRAAAVCLFYNGMICLGKRTLECPLTNKPIPFAGYWSAFGGSLNEGENAMAGAARELEEETQIKLNPFELSYMTELDNDDSSTYILYAYHSSKLLFPTLNYEHTEAGFFKIDSLKNSPTPMCSNLISAILSYEDRRWKGI